MSSLSSFFRQVCGKCLQLSERTDVVLTAIDAMRDSSVYDKEATKVLCKLTQQPVCLEKLETLFPKLLVGLLIQTSHTAEVLPLLESSWARSEQHEANRPSPFRFVVESIKTLLCTAGCEEHVLNIQKEGGWDMLLGPQTHQRGLDLLAREMRKSPAEQRSSLFQHLRGILHCREKFRMTFDMPFYIELMACSDLEKDLSNVLLLQSYLTYPWHIMQVLVLRGLITLFQKPEQGARELQILVKDILSTLNNRDMEVKMNALLVLRSLLSCTKRMKASHITLQLGEKVLPLTDDSGPVSPRSTTKPKVQGALSAAVILMAQEVECDRADRNRI
ncbi:unnamed protein product [Bubo scandiacus]